MPIFDSFCKHLKGSRYCILVEHPVLCPYVHKISNSSKFMTITFDDEYAKEYCSKFDQIGYVEYDHPEGNSTTSRVTK